MKLPDFLRSKNKLSKNEAAAAAAKILTGLEAAVTSGGWEVTTKTDANGATVKNFHNSWPTEAYPDNTTLADVTLAYDSDSRLVSGSLRTHSPISEDHLTANVKEPRVYANGNIHRSAYTSPAEENTPETVEFAHVMLGYIATK